MAVSLKDISRVTNINTCSISQVLNNHPKAMTLRPETREKILAAAKELGYCKNEMAASMTQKNSKVLAFVTCPMGSIEYTGIIQNGILNTVTERGYTIIVCRLETMTEEEIIAKIIGWRIAGVVFHVARREVVSKIVEALNKNLISYGFVNLSNHGGIGVTSDDYNGIGSAVKYLVDRNHRKIAFARVFLQGNYEYDLRRMQGYYDSMAKFCPQQKPQIINITGADVADKQRMHKIIRSLKAEGVDGVVCVADFIAVALNNAVLEIGERVPDIFSLVGYGDSVVAKVMFPPLTTVYQDFTLMGETTVNFIIDNIENKNMSMERNIMHPTSILERESVKKYS